MYVKGPLTEVLLIFIIFLFIINSSVDDQGSVIGLCYLYYIIRSEPVKIMIISI